MSTIDTQEWKERLANYSGIALSNIEKLINEMHQLTHNRLGRNEEVVLPYLGTLSTRLRNEHIGALPNGEKYLVPPRFELTLAPQMAHDYGITESILKETAHVNISSVHTFLNSSTKLANDLLSEGHTLVWERIGQIVLSQTQQNEFIFSPDQTLLDVVNKSFNSYRLEVLRKEFPRLEVISYSSKDDILQPYSLSGTPPQGI